VTWPPSVSNPPLRLGQGTFLQLAKDEFVHDICQYEFISYRKYFTKNISIFVELNFVACNRLAGLLRFLNLHRKLHS
jgi:hypothetical protein